MFFYPRIRYENIQSDPVPQILKKNALGSQIDILLSQIANTYLDGIVYNSTGSQRISSLSLYFLSANYKLRVIYSGQNLMTLSFKEIISLLMMESIRNQF